ncbi:MAG: LytR C-terminal domain-containing protein, partial [Acidimicrobiia bacterium]|nr:LytR C-terminal domain-containing protein [Acidimicrobiia bacterium]
MDEVPQSARELNRSARKSTAARARRRIALAVLGAALIIGTSVVLTFLTLREPEVSETGVGLPSARGASALIVITDAGGRADSIALLVAHPTDGSEVVLFPPSLLAILPGFGESEIADAVRFNGPLLARTTVINLLGVRVDAVVHLESADFAAAVGKPLTVDLANPLLFPESDGFTVVAAEGSAERDPDMLAALLTNQGDSDQLEWLDRQGSVWRAALRAVDGDPAMAERLTLGAAVEPETALQAILAAAGDSELVVTAVPVRRIEAAGGSTERYQLPSSAVAAFVSERFPYLVIREEPRPRVEVLNGNGRIGTTGPIAALLVEKGYRIIKTDNADRDNYTETQVIAQGREHQKDAIDVQGILGTGEVLLELRQPSGIVDLTIIV